MQQPIVDVSLNNAREVLDASMQKLVLFQFWSARSEGCTQLSPVLEKIVRQYPNQLLLARVDCDKEPDLAMQFGVQSLPTVMMIKQGRPVDGFAGVETEQAILTKLAAYLPKPEDELLAQAEQKLAEQDYAAAYPLLKQALTLAPARSDIKVWLADTAVSLGQLPQAEALLGEIKLAEQDALYKSVQAKLKLAKEAADTPEIQALQAQLAQDDSNQQLKEQLAIQYQAVQRSEEALALLLSILQQDLNFGSSKKLYLDILAALPKGDSVANHYRRKLYSLLY
ncbi:tetratricopeptide repeat protein [Rheinheimera nanhaiensis]|uniref:Thioredoxin domain-containing protein n=1 Tax=Rheinheimera nanhaiensis E407-8 TaxID=562729 RepID=I1DZS5_9GAMM|nr:tetratricopeptide repeat protein [Rheinheimera nanhaiensis]GAB59553.1 thioredoxin domain-containing protein [Rheinheimera nanhaiensis E407-8]